MRRQRRENAAGGEPLFAERFTLGCVEVFPAAGEKTR
jgi:hypothetical protein